MTGQGEAVHLESAVGLLVNIKMALIPGGRQIVCALGRFVEEMSGAAAEERQNDVGIVTGIDLVARKFRRSVVTKLAEVTIERTVFLQHHDDVLDALQAGVGD